MTIYRGQDLGVRGSGGSLDRHNGYGGKGKDVSIVGKTWRYLGQDKDFRTHELPLSVGEHLIVSTRLHWFSPCKKFLQMSAVMPLAFVVSVALDYLSVGIWQLQAALWVSTLLHQLFMAHKVMSWRSELLIVTNKRLVIVSGVFSRLLEEDRLCNTTNYRVWQPPMGRVFGYGQITVESAGNHDKSSMREVVHLVPNPWIIYDAIQTANV